MGIVVNKPHRNPHQNPTQTPLSLNKTQGNATISGTDWRLLNWPSVKRDHIYFAISFPPRQPDITHLDRITQIPYSQFYFFLCIHSEAANGSRTAMKYTDGVTATVIHPMCTIRVRPRGNIMLYYSNDYFLPIYKQYKKYYTRRPKSEFIILKTSTYSMEIGRCVL